MTAKQTYAEEMEAIVESAVEEAAMLSASASASLRGPEMVDSSPLSAVPEVVATPSTASKIVRLKVSPPGSSLVTAGVLGGDGVAASRPVRPKAMMGRSFDAEFVPPALSEDCCVTFAERGVVRSVGAVRGGWFEEKGVLMGTRFIVG